MIIALTQDWHNLLLGVDEELTLSSHATVRCVITDCKLEEHLRWHLWKRPRSRSVHLNSRYIHFSISPQKSPALQMLKRHTCMFLYFPLVQSMRNCNLFFWPLRVGQAQSGFNHKTPWPSARTEWGKLLVYLWRPYKHEHRCTAKQLSTLYAAGRDALTRVQLQVEAVSQGDGSKSVYPWDFIYLVKWKFIWLWASMLSFLLVFKVFQSTVAVTILKAWLIWITHPEQVQC